MKFVKRKQVELAAFSQRQLLFDFLEEDKPELILELSFNKYKVSFEQNISDFVIPLRKVATMKNDRRVDFCLQPASCMNSQAEDSLEELDLNPEDEFMPSREQDLRKPRKVFDVFQQIKQSRDVPLRKEWLDLE